MQTIKLKPEPSLALDVDLGGQPVHLDIRQKSTGMFLDLTVADRRLLAGVICQDRNRLVRSTYLGFIGDLAFVDTQGSSDPTYTGLGSRFLLMWLEPSDTPAAIGF